MYTLLFYAFAAFGLAFIVGHSHVSFAVRVGIGRWWGKFGRWVLRLLECPACFGFWIGLVTGLFAPPPDGWGRPFFALALGLFTTGSNFALGRWTGLSPEEYEHDYS